MTPSPQYAAGAVDARELETDMTVEEARAVLEGSAPDLMTTGTPFDAPTGCGGCGTMIIHGPTHERFHAALATLAAAVGLLGEHVDVPDAEPDTAPSNEPRIGANGLPV
jgi:hypothetical protein